MITVSEQLTFLAKGGRRDYLHGKTENKKTTNLQNFLDEFWARNPAWSHKWIKLMEEEY